jgi:gluconolactonase
MRVLELRHPNDIAGCQSAQTHLPLHSTNRDPPGSCCVVIVREVRESPARCGRIQSATREKTMHRRAFLTATAAAASAVTLKAAYAATVSPLGATGVMGRSTEPLPLGPLSGSVYPDPHVESLKKPKGAFGASGFPAFAGTMAVERVATGFRWAEGPVYFPAGRYVLFSDIPNNRIMRLSEDDNHLSVFRYPSFNSNGNTIDREGGLITCEHGAGV